MSMAQICDVLRYLVPYVQFKKREKHPWRSRNATHHIFQHLFFAMKSVIKTARQYKLSAVQGLETAVQCMVHDVCFEFWAYQCEKWEKKP